MTYAANQLFNSVDVGPILRYQFKSVRPKTFATDGAGGTIPKLALLAYNTSTNKYQAWDYTVTKNQVDLITTNSTHATTGTWTLTVNGITTAALAATAAAATIKAAILQAGIAKTADVTVVDGAGGLGTNSGTVTITWGGALAGQPLTVSADFSGLNHLPVLTQPTPGVNDNGLSVFKGFAAEAIVLDATNDVLGNVGLAGLVHIDDIPLNGQLLADIKTVLRTQSRVLGFTIDGLDQVR